MIDLIVQVFRCPSIEDSTVLTVALAIARRCGDENGVCFAKQATLAADTRMSTKSVQRALAAMEAADPPLIRRVKGDSLSGGRRTTDRIYLTLPAVSLPATGRDTLSAPCDSVSPDHATLSPRPGTQSPIRRDPLRNQMKSQTRAMRASPPSNLLKGSTWTQLWPSSGLA